MDPRYTYPYYRRRDYQPPIYTILQHSHSAPPAQPTPPSHHKHPPKTRQSAVSAPPLPQKATAASDESRPARDFLTPIQFIANLGQLTTFENTPDLNKKITAYHAIKDKSQKELLDSFAVGSNAVQEILSLINSLAEKNPRYQTPSGLVLLGIEICCELQAAKLPPPAVDELWEKILQRAKLRSAPCKTPKTLSAAILDAFTAPPPEKNESPSQSRTKHKRRASFSSIDCTPLHAANKAKTDLGILSHPTATHASPSVKKRISFKIVQAWLQVLAFVKLLSTHRNPSALSCSIITIMSEVLAGFNRGVMEFKPYLHIQSEGEAKEIICFPFMLDVSMKTLQRFFESLPETDTSLYAHLLDNLSGLFFEDIRLDHIDVSSFLKTQVLEKKTLKDFTSFLIQHPSPCFLRLGLLLGFANFELRYKPIARCFESIIANDKKEWPSENQLVHAKNENHPREAIELSEVQLHQITYRFCRQRTEGKELDKQLRFNVLRNFGNHMFCLSPPFAVCRKERSLPIFEEQAASPPPKKKWENLLSKQDICASLASFHDRLDERAYSRAEHAAYLQGLFLNLRQHVQNISVSAFDEELVHALTRVVFHFLQDWHNQPLPNPTGINLSADFVWLANHLIGLNFRKNAARLLLEAGNQALFDPASLLRESPDQLPILDKEFLSLAHEDFSCFEAFLPEGGEDYDSLAQQNPLASKEFSQMLRAFSLPLDKKQIEHVIDVLLDFIHKAERLHMEEDALEIIFFIHNHIQTNSSAAHDPSLTKKLEELLYTCLSQIPIEDLFTLHETFTGFSANQCLDVFNKRLANEKNYALVRDFLIDNGENFQTLCRKQQENASSLLAFKNLLSSHIYFACKDPRNIGVCKKAITLLAAYQNLLSSLIPEVCKKFSSHKDKALKQQLVELLSSCIERNNVLEQTSFLRTAISVLETGISYDMKCSLQKIANWALAVQNTALKEEKDKIITLLSRTLVGIAKESKKELSEEEASFLLMLRNTHFLQADNHEILRLTIDFPLIRVLLKSPQGFCFHEALSLFHFHLMHSCSKDNTQQFFCLLQDILVENNKKATLSDVEKTLVSILAKLDLDRFSTGDLMSLTEIILAKKNGGKPFYQEGITIANRVLQRLINLQDTQLHSKEFRILFQRKGSWFKSTLECLLSLDYFQDCHQWIEKTGRKKWLLNDADFKSIETRLFEKESESLLQTSLTTEGICSLQNMLKRIISMLREQTEKGNADHRLLKKTLHTAVFLLTEHNTKEPFQDFQQNIVDLSKIRLRTMQNRRKDEINALYAQFNNLITLHLEFCTDFKPNEILYQATMNIIQLALEQKQNPSINWPDIYPRFIQVFTTKRPKNKSVVLYQTEHYLLQKIISKKLPEAQHKQILNTLLKYNIEINLFSQNAKDIYLELSVIKDMLISLVSNPTKENKLRIREICKQQFSLIRYAPSPFIYALYKLVNPYLANEKNTRFDLITQFLDQATSQPSISTYEELKQQIEMIELPFAKDNMALLDNDFIRLAIYKLFRQQLVGTQSEIVATPAEEKQHRVLFWQSHIALLKKITSIASDPSVKITWPVKYLILNLFITHHDYVHEVCTDEQKETIKTIFNNWLSAESCYPCSQPNSVLELLRHAITSATHPEVLVFYSFIKSNMNNEDLLNEAVKMLLRKSVKLIPCPQTIQDQQQSIIILLKEHCHLLKDLEMVDYIRKISLEWINLLLKKDRPATGLHAILITSCLHIFEELSSIYINDPKTAKSSYFIMLFQELFSKFWNNSYIHSLAKLANQDEKWQKVYQTVHPIYFDHFEQYYSPQLRQAAVKKNTKKR